MSVTQNKPKESQQNQSSGNYFDFLRFLGCCTSRSKQGLVEVLFGALTASLRSNGLKIQGKGHAK